MEEPNVNKEFFEADVTLTPWVNYTFRVIAENLHGRSDLKVDDDPEDIAKPMSCHTRPSFPYSNPEGVRAEGTEPDNIVIYWQPMNKYLWNAPNLQYLVRYKLNEPHTAWTEFMVEDSLENHTIIREQPTFREFLVQIKAMNAMGPSIIEPDTVKGYSGEDVPESPPADFRITHFLNFSSVNFTWEPVTVKSVNGFFEGYEIEFWKNHLPSRKSKIRVPSSQTFKVISSFSANTNYTVVIRTMNRRYASASSRELSFETPEGIPSRVHNLRVFAVGALSILVLWDPPKQPNGLLRGYFLTFENDGNETEETYVLHKQHSYLHEKSLPDTGYKVAVWAETSAGEGERTIRPVRTWPIRNPDPPLFRVTNISLEAVDVEWMPANHSIWRMPGSAFYINYTLEDSEEYFESPTIYLPETKLRINGLKEESKYLMSGVAKDGPRMTYSVPLSVTTLATENVSHLNQEKRLLIEYLRNAAWFVAVLCAVAIALATVLVTCCCEERRGGKYAVRRKEMEIGHQLENDEERQFLEYQYGFKS
uniref:Protein-tyrosine-phosphatase n=1 Tax=Heterorhabditis bacteriophora TaxID=37862 RepID=A0A1I7WMD6_HETBA